MVSIEFLYFFIPAFMALYSVVSSGIRAGLIVLSSAAMICWSNPAGLVPMAVSVLSGYLGGIMIHNFHRRKYVSRIVLALTVIINAAMFFMFFRSSYGGESMIGRLGPGGIWSAAPIIGASVYTLHAISYCCDVFSGKCRCEHRFLRAAGYIAFFPSLYAGPILSYGDMRRTLRRSRLSLASCAKGIRLLLAGMAQKLILSNTMYELWLSVRETDPDRLPAFSAWIGIAAFGFFVYFELVSFALIACGMGAMMGFDLPQNFNEPFTAVSLKDLISRFNVTLYGWVKSYVYMPLSSALKGGAGELAAVFLSVIAGMLWYGIGVRTLLFAAVISLLLLIERLLGKRLEKLPAAVRRIGLIVIMLITLPILAFQSPVDAVRYVGAMFGANRIAADMLSENLLKTYFWFIAACIFMSSGIISRLRKKADGLSIYIVTVIQPVWVIALLLLCTSFMISGNGRLAGFLL